MVQQKQIMMQSNTTPLSRALAGEASSCAVTPLDALKVGRKRWLSGERINMGAIAKELGINRATLFRWVGSRDLFIGEVIWSFYRELLDATYEDTAGHGPDYVASVCERLLRKVMKSEPLQQFIQQDPQYAIRILTSKFSLFQTRSVNAVWKLITEQSRNTDWVPPIDEDDLAFLIVRLGESFLYGDIISGHKTKITQIATAFRLLTAGRDCAERQANS